MQIVETAQAFLLENGPLDLLESLCVVVGGEGAACALPGGPTTAGGEGRR